MASRQNYRHWTEEEDAKLVEAMVDLVNAGNGFKADNGFKAGYLKEVEAVFKKTLPDSGLLGKPHIESRLKTLKKDWQVVYDMIYGYNTSGFGYDSEKHCVTAEPTVWDAYLKVHKQAAKWKNKSFPLFEDLCIVFGKDRAKGNRARDFAEMEAEANKEEEDEDGNDFNEGREDSLTAPTDTGANVTSEECTSAPRKRKRARSQDSLLEGLSGAATLLGNKIEEASSKLGEAIQSDLDIQKKTSLVFSELSKFASLSMTDRFKATNMITSEPEKVLVFFSIEKEEEREAWVRYLLGN